MLTSRLRPSKLKGGSRFVYCWPIFELAGPFPPVFPEMWLLPYETTVPPLKVMPLVLPVIVTFEIRVTEAPDPA